MSGRLWSYEGDPDHTVYDRIRAEHEAAPERRPRRWEQRVGYRDDGTVGLVDVEASGEDAAPLYTTSASQAQEDQRAGTDAWRELVRDREVRGGD